MANRFFDTLKLNNSLGIYLRKARQGITLAVFGVPFSFKLFLSSVLENKVLLIENDVLSSKKAVTLISEFSDKKVVYVPPKDETLILNRASSKETLFSRISAIEKIADADVIVLPIESALQLFPKKIDSIFLKKDQETDLNDLVRKIVSFGYKRVERVEVKGTFALRGDILDIFIIDSEMPIRIDFFGDTIESIKHFDTETGKNLGFIKEIKILQAVEFNFESDDVLSFNEIIRKEVDNLVLEPKIRLKDITDSIDISINSGDLEGISLLAPLSKDAVNIFDLIGEDCTVIFDEGKKIAETLDLIFDEFSKRQASLCKAGETFTFTSKNCLNKEQFIDLISSKKKIALSTLATSQPFFNPIDIINPKASGIVNYKFSFEELYNDLKSWLKGGLRVIAYAGNKQQADFLAVNLHERHIEYTFNESEENKVLILDKELTNGFIFHEANLVVIGSGNLFSKSSLETKIKVKKKGFFTAPTSGDYCVHEVHGIGRVLGDKKITSLEGTKDYIAVEYAGGDILYVPVEQMDVLTRYLGSEKHPKLSKIGGKDFERIKERVKESIKKMSFDLKMLYKEREAQKGFTFTVDNELYSAFNENFEFIETVDQKKAEEDIISDMTSGKVMDRLICGDVGFGKTEVALRATFIAVSNGKQVAFLAPTTILTEQHYNTAIKRFADFGIKIACLNRFRTKKQQEEILRKVKDGEIDLIIGTHRLLSNDVSFKDLGLLVLDEEQRFGVEHKEKIKLLKKNVDTITLTATPIPRTLHLSLSGIRPISVINTPPSNRLPVQTYVTEETEMLIVDAVNREINRGGQAFILYNRVETIFSFANRIKEILPNVKIAVVHGRMEEKILEEKILAFYRGEYDLLVSTTLIENGIDIVRANTLIVIDADKMGLSTLYQLKGRVGRSDRLAYAYFTFKKDKILSENAYNRLNAIVEFAEMGSGIKVAMRDLEIRGAGNVLGAEQHGHMDKIGYELYSKLLKEQLTSEEQIQPDLDIRVSAFIPENYIENTSSRMDAYKEIAEIDSVETEKEFISSIGDTFGKIPSEVYSLIDIVMCKLFAIKLKLKGITITKNSVFISLFNYNSFSDKKLQKSLDRFNEFVKISMTGTPKIIFLKTDENNRDMLKRVREFLQFAF